MDRTCDASVCDQETDTSACEMKPFSLPASVVVAAAAVAASVCSVCSLVKYPFISINQGNFSLEIIIIIRKECVEKRRT